MKEREITARIVSTLTLRVNKGKVTGELLQQADVIFSDLPPGLRDNYYNGKQMWTGVFDSKTGKMSGRFECRDPVLEFPDYVSGGAKTGRWEGVLKSPNFAAGAFSFDSPNAAKNWNWQAGSGAQSKLPDLVVAQFTCEREEKNDRANKRWEFWRMRAVIRNAGSGDVPSPFRVQLEGAPPPAASERWLKFSRLVPIKESPLSAGKETVVEWTTLPTSTAQITPLPVNAVALRVVVDPDNAVKEGNENNNRKTLLRLSCPPHAPLVASGPVNANKEVKWVEVPEPEDGTNYRDTLSRLTRKSLPPHAQNDLTNLLNRIKQRKQDYAAAALLKKELDTALRQADNHLDNAIDRLSNAENAMKNIETAVNKAKTIEDIYGIVSLIGGLGKAALQKLCVNPKFQSAVGKLAGKSPKDIMQLERLLKSYGAELPSNLQTMAHTVDKARREAVAEALNKLGLTKASDEALKDIALVEKGQVKLSGSAAEVFDFKGGKWMAKDLEFKNGKWFAKTFKGGTEVLEEVKWKGLGSDVDVWVSGADRVDFLKKVEQYTSDRLTRNSLKGVEAAGDVKVNAFTKNLGRLDVSKPNDLFRWRKEVSSISYLREQSAYRTYGSQVLARVLTRETVPAMTRLDGVDIVYEMAHRAEMAVKNGSLSGPAVFKEIAKSYERGYAGLQIASRADDALRNFDYDAYSRLLPDKGKLLDKELYEKAQDVVKKGGSDRAAAEEMLARIRNLKNEASRIDATIQPLQPNRRYVSDYGKRLLDAERTGKASLLPTSSGGRGILADMGVDLARRQWADDLYLPTWQYAGLDPRRALRYAGFGLLDTVFNPITYTGLGLVGLAHRLGLWDSPIHEDVQKAAESVTGGAKDSLLKAEEWWQKLASTFAKLRPPDDLFRDMDESLKAIPAEFRCRYEHLAKSDLTELDDDYRKLHRFVSRVQEIREEFSREAALNLIAEDMDLRGLPEKIRMTENAFNLAVSRYSGLKPSSNETTLTPEKTPEEFAKKYPDAFKAWTERERLREELTELKAHHTAAVDAHKFAQKYLPDSWKFSDLAKSLSKDVDWEGMDDRIISYLEAMRETVSRFRNIGSPQ